MLATRAYAATGLLVVLALTGDAHPNDLHNTVM